MARMMVNTEPITMKIYTEIMVSLSIMSFEAGFKILQKRDQILNSIKISFYLLSENGEEEGEYNGESGDGSDLSEDAREEDVEQGKDE